MTTDYYGKGSVLLCGGWTEIANVTIAVDYDRLCCRPAVFLISASIFIHTNISFPRIFFLGIFANSLLSQKERRKNESSKSSFPPLEEKTGVS